MNGSLFLRAPKQKNFRSKFRVLSKVQAGRMLRHMAAKSKPTHPRAHDDEPQSSNMLLRASDVREHLLGEARTLRAAGKIREARGVEKRAAQVDQLVGALKADHQPPPKQTVNS